MALKVQLRLDIGQWKQILPDIRCLVKKAADQAWKKGNQGELEIPVKQAEVSILLTDDAAVHKLNK